MDFILLLMIPFWSFDLELLPVLPSRLNNLLLWGFLFWLLALLLAAPLSAHRPGDRKTCCGRAGSRDPQPGLSWSSDSVVSHRQWERSSTFPSPNPEHRSLLSHPSSRSCQTFIKHDKGLERLRNIIISVSLKKQIKLKQATEGGMVADTSLESPAPASLTCLRLPPLGPDLLSGVWPSLPKGCERGGCKLK